jgi:hypothetical protein
VQRHLNVEPTPIGSSRHSTSFFSFLTVQTLAIVYFSNRMLNLGNVNGTAATAVATEENLVNEEKKRVKEHHCDVKK